MKKHLCAAAAILLISPMTWVQGAGTHAPTTKVTTTSNGKVTSTTNANSCHDEKGKFVKCSSTVKTSMMTNVTKDNSGKCHIASGPKKGQFTKCP